MLEKSIAFLIVGLPDADSQLRVDKFRELSNGANLLHGTVLKRGMAPAGVSRASRQLLTSDRDTSREETLVASKSETLWD